MTENDALAKELVRIIDETVNATLEKVVLAIPVFPHEHKEPECCCCATLTRVAASLVNVVNKRRAGLAPTMGPMQSEGEN